MLSSLTQTSPFPAMAQPASKAKVLPVSRPLSLVRGGLFLIFAFMLIAALHPGLRAGLRSVATSNHRTVLSTVHGNLVGNGVELTVAKVRNADGLFIEIYEPKTDGGQKLMERIQLPDHNDGYFNLNGQATNLAVDDIDNDGKLEILAPSFDANMVGHLNVYHYDEGSGEFTRSKI